MVHAELSVDQEQSHTQGPRQLLNSTPLFRRIFCPHMVMNTLSLQYKYCVRKWSNNFSSSSRTMFWFVYQVISTNTFEKDINIHALLLKCNYFEYDIFQTDIKLNRMPPVCYVIKNIINLYKILLNLVIQTCLKQKSTFKSITEYEVMIIIIDHPVISSLHRDLQFLSRDSLIFNKFQ